MSQDPYKICPKCKQTAVLNMQVCGRCGHKFSTQFPVISSPSHNSIYIVPQQTPQCRNCSRKFNFLTKIQYDSESGFCKQCLSIKLQEFTGFYTNQLLNKSEPPYLEQVRNVTAFARSKGLVPAIAYRTVRHQSLQLLYRHLLLAKRIGNLTDTNEQNIALLERELCLTSETTASIHSEIADFKISLQIRSGKLPKISSSVMMSSSEICHWDTPCIYAKTLSSQVKHLSGRLIISNQKIRFISEIGGFEFGISKIASVHYLHNGITMELTRTQGNGFYALEKGELVYEILSVLLKHYHRHEIFDQPSSRHIPQKIKKAVYERDGGKCIQCGQAAYLEFDHIIPHVKGGANSLNNVQLLCRKCNLEKSDNIY